MRKRLIYLTSLTVTLHLAASQSDSAITLKTVSVLQRTASPDPFDVDDSLDFTELRMKEPSKQELRQENQQLQEKVAQLLVTISLYERELKEKDAQVHRFTIENAQLQRSPLVDLIRQQQRELIALKQRPSRPHRTLPGRSSYSLSLSLSDLQNGSASPPSSDHPHVQKRE